jgi:hypothetical protein
MVLSNGPFPTSDDDNASMTSDDDNVSMASDDNSSVTSEDDIADGDNVSMTSDDDASGDNASGDDASGDNASGDDASGDNASGDDASGDDASGDDASGDDASGGDNAPIASDDGTAGDDNTPMASDDDDASGDTDAPIASDEDTAGDGNALMTSVDDTAPSNSSETNSISPQDPLPHKGARILKKHKLYRQGSCLRGKRALYPLPVHTPWDLDLSSHRKKSKSLRLKLLRRQSRENYLDFKAELDQQRVQQERLRSQRRSVEVQAERQATENNTSVIGDQENVFSGSGNESTQRRKRKYEAFQGGPKPFAQNKKIVLFYQPFLDMINKYYT